MFIYFPDIDIGTKRRILSAVGAKLINKFGSVPNSLEEFQQEFDEVEADTNVISILKEQYDATGFTVMYTVDQVYTEYLNIMK